MIRATTGRPTRNKSQDKQVIRPSSAKAKLQSFAYSNLIDEIRPCTAVKHSSSAISLGKVSAADTSKEAAKPLLERRLTLGTVDGIGENAKALTRLNTPASSMKKIKIEERITLEQLHKIKTAFEEADTDGSGTLDIDEFKTVVKTCLGVKGRNEEQIVALFMKIDSSSDGEVDWDEFCTYMQLEYAEKEEAIYRSKRVSFVLPALTSPTPHNRAPILRIICVADSSYVCAGQDGMLTFWSPNLKLRRTKSILESVPAERPAYVNKPSVWVTDVVMIPAHGKLLVGTGERELHFYDILNFEFYCQIIGLDAVPLRMDLKQIEEDQCLIVYGDDQGCVSIMMFDAIGDTLRTWKKVPKVNGVPTVTMCDVANGVGTSFVKWKVHDDWVTELRYFHELRSVVSACNRTSSALVRGCTTASTALDRLKQATGRGQLASPSITQPIVRRKAQAVLAQKRQKADQSVFSVYKGVKTFDFSPKHNIIASGGMDRILRLWNPYVPQKPTGLLRGHNSPILFISIDDEDGRIFSISADKCVKVWDLVEQNCLVTVNPKLHKIHGEIATCAYACHSHTLAIVTDQFSLLQISSRNSKMLPAMASRFWQAKLAGEMSVTHNEAVTCCAHNPSFGHVITCSEGSVVRLWDFETGTFMFEFNKAHGDGAVTNLMFDSSGRRLITSGRDGAVRIWNYNNGHCLRSLERENCDKEVTDCVYVEINKNRYVVAVGWDHRINIFADETEFLHHVQRPYDHWPDDLRRGHTEDIVSVAFGHPNILATVSYDGLIIIWNIVSGHSVARINYPQNGLPTQETDEDDEESLAGDFERETETGKQAVNKILLVPNRLLDKEGAALLAGCSDGAVIFWNLQTRKAYARWRATRRNSSICSMVLSSDCAELYVGDHFGFMTIWDVETYAMKPLVDLSEEISCPDVTEPPYRLAQWRCHVQPITCIALVEANNVLLTSSNDCSVRVWTITGQYIGCFGQATPWDIHDPSTWQHPMVPPEVLIDPLSMPEHSVLNDICGSMEADSEESSESEEETTGSTNESPRAKDRLKSLKFSSKTRRPSMKWSGGGSVGSDAWRRRLSRRLSRSSMMGSAEYFTDEDIAMLDEVRRDMMSSSGKRLRHEKLVAQQRHLQTTRDASAHAFQSLQYFDLAEPPQDVDKPNPGAHIDDVFVITEEDEEVDL